MAVWKFFTPILQLLRIPLFVPSAAGFSTKTKTASMSCSEAGPEKVTSYPFSSSSLKMPRSCYTSGPDKLTLTNTLFSAQQSGVLTLTGYITPLRFSNLLSRRHQWTLLEVLCVSKLTESFRSSITELDLSWCGLGKPDVPCLEDFVSEFPSVSRLNLSGNGLFGPEAINLVNSLRCRMEVVVDDCLFEDQDP